MTRKPISNVSASVKARLLTEARGTQRPFNELLQRYTMERFLFRLASSRHVKDFLLKGALMLRALGAELSRPTMDIDLLGETSNSHAALRRVIEDCVAIEANDGISFDTADMSLQNIVEGADYHGVRIRFLGRLGPARIPMQIDIGFGDAVVPKPVWIELPEVLDFGAPRLRACTAETAIAEKLHAAISRETINSRMKDFYDMYMMGRHLKFKGASLARAISATFENRSTAIPSRTPPALSPGFAQVPGKQEQWNAFIRKLQIEDPLLLVDVVSYLADFLIPVLDAAAKGQSFDLSWSPAGPWA